MRPVACQTGVQDRSVVGLVSLPYRKDAVLYGRSAGKHILLLRLREGRGPDGLHHDVS